MVRACGDKQQDHRPNVKVGCNTKWVLGIQGAKSWC
jgi:hypothetical protein